MNLLTASISSWPSSASWLAGWLAKSPLAYFVLDRGAGEFFLRSRATAFPGVEGSYGVDKLRLPGDRGKAEPAVTNVSAARPCARGEADS